MVFSYLTSKNIFDKFDAAKERHEKLTVPFPEFARIAQNKPLASIPKEYPKTTDGTTASIIRKTGRRVVQQLPTGVISADDSNDWLPIVAEFILTNKILPHANKDYDLIQKCWATIENGLTFGSQAVYTPFLKKDTEFSTDYQLIYWGDIFLQPGKKSAYDAEYIFMREWYQKEDIEAIIAQETKRKQSDIEADSSWDVAALKDILEATKKKDEISQTPVETDRQLNESAIEIITGFQRGVGANFITFNPDLKKVVRTKKNRDPRGKMPVDFFYADTDGTNPLGRGVIELIGGIQNLIDGDMQMYQYNRALMLAPPIVKRGSFNKNKIVYKPNAIIDLGSDQSASIDTLKIDTSAVTNYPSLYGLQKSQLLNLVSSPDTSISAEVGNPGFSKTHAGVEQQNTIISIDDNFLRKMFEAFFENKCETDINRYFAEREGVEELQLDTATAQRLRKLIEEGKLDPSFVSDDNTILIDYSQATEALRFRVDASTSKMKTDGEQLEALSSLLERLESSPLLQQAIPQEKIIATWNGIVAASGVEDPENLSVDLEEYKEQQEAMQEQQEAAMQQASSEDMSMREQQAIPAEIMQDTAEQQVEPQSERLDEEAISGIAESMSSMGYDNQTIAEAIDMHEKGYSPDEIIEALRVKEEEVANV